MSSGPGGAVKWYVKWFVLPAIVVALVGGQAMAVSLSRNMHKAGAIGGGISAGNLKCVGDWANIGLALTAGEPEPTPQEGCE